MPKLESAINDVNRALLDDGDATLNYYYDCVGLTSLRMGDSFGWSGRKIEGKYSTVLTSDGRPAISVGFRTAPKENLGL